MKASCRVVFDWLLRLFRVSATADVIRTHRQRRGWSQQQLADAVGVGLRQINRWESGEQIPSLAVSVKLAEALGVSLKHLADATDDVLIVVADAETRKSLVEQGLATEGETSFTRSTLAPRVMATDARVSLVRVEDTDVETQRRVQGLG